MRPSGTGRPAYEPWKRFLEDEHVWLRVNEQQFDNYILSKKAT